MTEATEVKELMDAIGVTSEDVVNKVNTSSEIAAELHLKVKEYEENDAIIERMIKLTAKKSGMCAKMKEKRDSWLDLLILARQEKQELLERVVELDTKLENERADKAARLIFKYQLEYIQERDLAAKTSDAKKETLKDKISQLKDTVANLECELESKQASLSTLQEQLKKLQRVKVMVVKPVLSESCGSRYDQDDPLSGCCPSCQSFTD